MSHLVKNAIVATVACALVAAGCGDESSTATGDAAPTADTVAETTSTTPPEPVELEVRSPRDRDVIRRPEVVVRGTATAGAKVTVNGRRAQVTAGGRWRRAVKLGLGLEVITVVASHPDRPRADETITVTRRRSAAELAELRRRRELARQRAEAEFKAAATTIPYNQLEKNADRYRGEKVVYRGQIFQIQEATSGGGIMLLSVTDEGYGFWTDNIWVDYDGHIESAEDDIITVYGTIRGTKSYETQIGGETYVPRVRARYIEE